MADAGGAPGGAEGEDMAVREQDRFLPIANISRCAACAVKPSPSPVHTRAYACAPPQRLP